MLLEGLELGADASGKVMFGLRRKNCFVTKLPRSACGHSEVDLQESSGISASDAFLLDELNVILDSATEAAIQAGTKYVQHALDIKSDAMAKDVFGGEPSDNAQRGIRISIGAYIQVELEFAALGATTPSRYMISRPLPYE